MRLENKYIKSVVILSIATLLLSFMVIKLPNKLRQKVEATITSTYAIENFTLEAIENTGDSKLIPQKDHLFKIQTNGEEKGYVYVGEANSMKNVYDYVLLFNTDLSVKKAKVLIYREEHGRQIGAQRWLKQFIGLKLNDSPTYGETIDAISGATISAKSMTIAVGKVLKRINSLKQKKLL